MLGNKAGKRSGGGENKVRPQGLCDIPRSRGKCNGTAGMALRAVVAREPRACCLATGVRGGVIGRGRDGGAALRAVRVMLVCACRSDKRRLMRARAYAHCRHALERQGDDKECSQEA